VRIIASINLHPLSQKRAEYDGEYYVAPYPAEGE
jgi:hypothetical protein